MAWNVKYVCLARLRRGGWVQYKVRRLAFQVYAARPCPRMVLSVLYYMKHRTAGARWREVALFE
jgi:hypothetical protein